MPGHRGDIGGTQAHDPKDGIVGIGEDEDVALVEDVDFFVGEEVADKPRPIHTERHETVAAAPGTQSEGEQHPVEVETGRRRRHSERFAAVRPYRHREWRREAVAMVGREDGTLAWFGIGRGYGTEQESIAVLDEDMRLREELLAALGVEGRKHLVGHGLAEAEGMKDMEQVGLEVRQLLQLCHIDAIASIVRHKQSRRDRPDGVGDDIGIGSEAAEIVAHRLVECGSDVAQQRHQLKPYAVAEIERLRVGGVLDEGEVVLLDIAVDLAAAEGEQRTDDDAVAQRYATKAVDAGATDEVNEERLDRVVAVVGRGDGGIMVLFGKLQKEAVAQFAGSLLDREVIVGGIAVGVEISHIAADTVCLSQRTHKGLVTVAVARPQMEIAMGDGERYVGRGDEMGQHHRVASATDSQQHLLPRGEEVLLAY